MTTAELRAFVEVIDAVVVAIARDTSRDAYIRPATELSRQTRRRRLTKQMHTLASK